MPGNIFDGAVRTCLGSVGFVFLFSLAVNLLMLATPLYMMQIFDRVLTSFSRDTLLFLLLIALVAVLALALLEGARGRVMIAAGTWLERRLGPATLERSIAASLVGWSYRTEALQDLASLRNTLGGQAVFALFDAPWVPVYLAVIFLLHPQMGLLATGGALALFALALINEWATRRHLKRAHAIAGRSNRLAAAAAENADVIEAMGMAPGVVGLWQTENAKALGHQRVASQRSTGIVATSKFIRLGLQIGMLTVGALLVLQQEITAGAMIAGSIIMGRALQPIEQAISAWKQVVSARGAFGRLRSFFANMSMRDDAIALPAPQGALSVEGLSYTPPNAAAPVLRNVSFALSPGEVLAVIGPTAAGKSTLARALVGSVKPTAGCVRLDNADVFAWPRAQFGGHVGYLPQDVELFAGTIAANIGRLGAADDEQIVAAATEADVHDLILRLPNGYETEIGAGGTMLSAGQRQRIALARALCGAPQLVVLDEPNSNLDEAGDRALVAALTSLKQRGATVVIVSHRRNVLQAVDRILVLQNGMVAKFGGRDEVLSEMMRRTDVAAMRAPTPPPTAAPQPAGT